MCAEIRDREDNVHKLMKSIVHDQIVDHMLNNSMCSRKQHGFSQMLTGMEIPTKIIEDRLPINVIYTDFAKAFDCVPRQRLLIKMNMLEITTGTIHS